MLKTEHSSLFTFFIGCSGYLVPRPINDNIKISETMNLYPPGVCRGHDVFLWCYVCFVVLCFRLYALTEAAALSSIVFRYAGAPIATRVSFIFPFVYLEMSLFPNTFCTIAVFSLYGEHVVRFPLPENVFLPRDHGLNFLHQLV